MTILGYIVRLLKKKKQPTTATKSEGNCGIYFPKRQEVNKFDVLISNFQKQNQISGAPACGSPSSVVIRTEEAFLSSTFFLCDLCGGGKCVCMYVCVCMYSCMFMSVSQQLVSLCVYACVSEHYVCVSECCVSVYLCMHVQKTHLSCGYLISFFCLQPNNPSL